MLGMNNKRSRYQYFLTATSFVNDLSFINGHLAPTELICLSIQQHLFPKNKRQEQSVAYQLVRHRQLS